ncbi:TIM23 complex component [Hanseniaspora vineae]
MLRINSNIYKRAYTTASNIQKTKPTNTELTWSKFFQIRRQERKINIGSSVLSAFLTSNIAFAYVATIEIDPTQTIFGLDPSIVLIGGVMTSAAFGYLIGPSIFGRPIFQLRHRSVLEGYNLKNKVFLKHIIKNRVDASKQSFSNPPPDYYGEKIGSLKEYRRWLRDCHAYRIKASEFI